ncbi:hypothetical protein ACFE04_022696 [Oxalis oulophora]
MNDEREGGTVGHGRREERLVINGERNRTVTVVNQSSNPPDITHQPPAKRLTQPPPPYPSQPLLNSPLIFLSYIPYYYHCHPQPVTTTHIRRAVELVPSEGRSSECWPSEGRATKILPSEGWPSECCTLNKGVRDGLVEVEH